MQPQCIFCSPMTMLFSSMSDAYLRNPRYDYGEFISVTCHECLELGSHHPNCPLDHHPLVVFRDRSTGHLDFVIDYGGEEIYNESPYPGQFQNGSLPAFAPGRALIMLEEHCIWQQFPQAFEKHLLRPQNPPPPPPTRDQPVSDNMPPASNSSRTLNFSSDTTQAAANRPQSIPRSTPTRERVHSSPAADHSPASIGISSIDPNTQTLSNALTKVAEIMSTSMQQNTTTSNEAVALDGLLKATPVFDGKRENFKPWKVKVDLCRNYCSKEHMYTHIKSKLGKIPLDFVSSLGSRATNADDLLDALSKQYDPYHQPLYAANQLARLDQGSKTIEEHHAHLTDVLAGSNETLQTTNAQIKAKYIESLRDTKVRKKIHSLLYDMEDEKKDTTTLEFLMQIASKAEYIEQISTKATAKATAAAVQVSTTGDEPSAEVIAAPAQASEKKQEHSKKDHQRRGKDDRPGNNQQHNSGSKRKWCAIHQKPGHETSECNQRDRTQCYWCHEQLEKGSYEYHVQAECNADICFKCKKKGHRAAECKTPRRSNGYNNNNKSNDRQRSNYHNNQHNRRSRSRSPRRSYHSRDDQHRSRDHHSDRRRDRTPERSSRQHNDRQRSSRHRSPAPERRPAAVAAPALVEHASPN